MFTIKESTKTKTFNGKKFELAVEGFKSKAEAEKSAKFYSPVYYTRIDPRKYKGISKVFYNLYVRAK